MISLEPTFTSNSSLDHTLIQLVTMSTKRVRTFPFQPFLQEARAHKGHPHLALANPPVTPHD